MTIEVIGYSRKEIIELMLNIGIHCGVDKFVALAAEIQQAARAASPAAPAQSGEPVGYLYTFANSQRPHDPIKRFSTYRFQKPDSLDETVVSCVPLYAAPQPAQTAQHETLENAK